MSKLLEPQNDTVHSSDKSVYQSADAHITMQYANFIQTGHNVFYHPLFGMTISFIYKGSYRKKDGTEHHIIESTHLSQSDIFMALDNYNQLLLTTK